MFGKKQTRCKNSKTKRLVRNHTPEEWKAWRAKLAARSRTAAEESDSSDSTIITDAHETGDATDKADINETGDISAIANCFVHLEDLEVEDATQSKVVPERIVQIDVQGSRDTSVIADVQSTSDGSEMSDCFVDLEDLEVEDATQAKVVPERIVQIDVQGSRDTSVIADVQSTSDGSEMSDCFVDLEDLEVEDATQAKVVPERIVQIDVQESRYTSVIADVRSNSDGSEMSDCFVDLEHLEVEDATQTKAVPDGMFQTDVQGSRDTSVIADVRSNSDGSDISDCFEQLEDFDVEDATQMIAVPVKTLQTHVGRRDTMVINDVRSTRDITSCFVKLEELDMEGATRTTAVPQRTIQTNVHHKSTISATRDCYVHLEVIDVEDSAVIIENAQEKSDVSDVTDCSVHLEELDVEGCIAVPVRTFQTDLQGTRDTADTTDCYINPEELHGDYSTEDEETTVTEGVQEISEVSDMTDCFVHLDELDVDGATSISEFPERTLQTDVRGTRTTSATTDRYVHLRELLNGEGATNSIAVPQRKFQTDVRGTQDIPLIKDCYVHLEDATEAIAAALKSKTDASVKRTRAQNTMVTWARRHTKWTYDQNISANKQAIAAFREETVLEEDEHNYGLLGEPIDEGSEGEPTIKIRRQAQPHWRSSVLRPSSAHRDNRVNQKREQRKPRHIPNILKRRKKENIVPVEEALPQFFLVQECTNIEKVFIRGCGMARMFPTGDGNFILEDIPDPEPPLCYPRAPATFAPGGETSSVPPRVLPQANDDRSKKQQILEHGLYQWLCGSPHWKMNSIWCDGRFRFKAKHLADQLNMSDFDISNEWVESFKLRHGVTEENSKGNHPKRFGRRDPVPDKEAPENDTPVTAKVECESDGDNKDSDDYDDYDDDDRYSFFEENDDWRDDSSNDIGEFGRRNVISGINDDTAQRNSDIASSIGKMDEDIGPLNDDLDPTNDTIGQNDDELNGTSDAIGQNDDGLSGLSDAIGENDHDINGTSDTIGEYDHDINGTSDTIGQNNDDLNGTIDVIGQNYDGLNGTNDVIGPKHDEISQKSDDIAQPIDDFASLSDGASDQHSIELLGIRNVDSSESSYVLQNLNISMNNEQIPKRPDLLDDSFVIDSGEEEGFDDIDDVINAAVDRIDNLMQQNESVGENSDRRTPNTLDYSPAIKLNADVATDVDGHSDVFMSTDVVIKKEPVDLQFDYGEESSECELLMSEQPTQRHKTHKRKLVKKMKEAIENSGVSVIKTDVAVPPAVFSSVAPRVAAADESSVDKLLVIMHDKAVAGTVMKDRAWKTIPDGLYIRLSNVIDMEDGVFTATLIPNGVCFGPYEGESTTHVDFINHGCVWKVYSGNRLHHYLDGNDNSMSNWMKFVRSASDTNRQNLEVFQHESKLYFRTTSDISPSSELLMASFHPLRYSIYSGDGSLKYYVPYNNTDGVCPLCGQNLGTLTAIKTHQMFHKGLNPHDCLTCGACFMSFAELKAHKRKEHPEVAPFTCINCNTWFSRTSDLVRHSSVHSSGRTCSVCGRNFQDSATLQVHMMRIHSLVLRHFCDACTVHFPTAEALQKHMEKHQKMQFKCIKCKMSFVCFSELMAHRKIHRIYKDSIQNKQKTIKEGEVFIKQDPVVTIKQEPS